MIMVKHTIDSKQGCLPLAIRFKQIPMAGYPAIGIFSRLESGLAAWPRNESVP
jgi:hypothetical protein